MALHSARHKAARRKAGTGGKRKKQQGKKSSKKGGIGRVVGLNLRPSVATKVPGG